MANNSALKQDIRDYIYTNHNEEITGNILRDVLLEMVDTLGAGWVYKGVAALNTQPGTPDTNVFYLATVPGTYQYFKNSSNVSLTVSDGEVAIFKIGSDGSWSKDTTGAATKAQLDQLGQEMDEIMPYFSPGSLFSIDGKYLNVNTGVLTNLAGYAATDFIKIDKSVDISLYGVSGSSAVGKLCFYDSDKQFISSIHPGSGDVVCPIADIPASAVYIRCSSLVTDPFEPILICNSYIGFNKIVQDLENGVLAVQHSGKKLISLFANQNFVGGLTDWLKNELVTNSGKILTIKYSGTKIPYIGQSVTINPGCDYYFRFKGTISSLNPIVEGGTLSWYISE